MRQAIRFSAAVVWAVAAACGAAEPKAPAPAGESLTVITSDRLTFDYRNRFALFEQNVVVVDAELRITADKMTVNFDEKNDVQLIQAEGRVVIVQEDKQARSAKAVYEVAQGTIVLTGSPEVTRGRDVLTGDTITFWRDENRMKVEPRARLVIHPGSGGARGTLMLGDPTRGK
jgi:lipopolysaccharide export system protein LptA